MAKIVIYSTRTCPYCIAAKRLLDGKRVPYTEIDLSDNPDERMKLVERSNGLRTVPQIFIDDRHIGGYDRLSELDQRGELDPLIHR